MRLRHLLFVGLTIPALVAGMVASPAFAQTATTQPQGQALKIPSVAVRPEGTTTQGPNGGEWFVADQAVPGTPIRFTAHILNPADVPQTIKLYLADLNFSTDSTPQVAATSKDVGTWGAFDHQSVTIPAKTTVLESFTITPPSGVEPGDHVGAMIAESQPQAAPDGQLLKIVTRVGTRVYITIPGEAQPKFTIDKVTMQRDSSFFPKEMTLRVVLRNTGRVRLHPTVTVNGHKAGGSDLLVSRSVETYVASVKVPAYGGPQSYKINVSTKVGTSTGPVQAMQVSTFIIPWILLVLLGAAVIVFGLLRFMLRRRGSKYANVQADLRRMEKLLADQRAGTAAPVVPPTPEPVEAPKVEAPKVEAPPPAPMPAPEPAPAPEPVRAAAPPHPAPRAMPDMAEILAGEPATPPPAPTRWSGLLDDIRSRRVEESDEAQELVVSPPVDQRADEPAADNGDGPTPHDADTAIRAAAKQARRAGDEETATRLEDSLNGWS